MTSSLKSPLLVFVASLLVFPSFQGIPQTKWFKYEGNPVLDVGPPGSWDGTLVIPSSVIREGSLYKMWYAGFSGTRYWHLGYATSQNGITWRKYPANPVLKAGPQSWDSSGATLAHVNANEPGYEMWYTGGEGTRTLQIGYATSLDGIHWRKALGENPVLTVGTQGSWDGRGVSHPSVIGPDRYGAFQMWFAGEDGSVLRIGHASSSTGKRWTKGDDPVLLPGKPGSWDEQSTFYPRVFYNEGIYEMWFGGMNRNGFPSRKIGYATSPNGIQWTETDDNPVLDTGPPGAWDHEAVLVGDLVFDGSLYQMWYHGIGGSLEVGVGNIGYAISPRGTRVDVSPASVIPGEPIHIGIRIPELRNLILSAEIHGSVGGVIGHVELLDDGQHGDGMASDGLYANSWVPGDEGLYTTDIKLEFGGMRFTHEQAASVTSIGPLRYDGVILVTDQTPTPGDSILVNIQLRNLGRSTAAPSVAASLSSTGTFIRGIPTSPLSFGDIAPGASIPSSTTFRLYIDPGCPVDSEIPMEISISSLGNPFWTDRFTLHVSPPWWRSNIAYFLYALLGLAVMLGLRRLEMRRVQLRHQRELETIEAQRLRELDQLKSRFFANISHEFRTPLTLIQGPAEDLASGDTREDPKDLARTIVRNSSRLLALVNQLLDLSKIEAGQMRLRVVHTDIVPFIKRVASSFESLAVRQTVRFSVESNRESTDGWVDRDALEKIMTNLLSNAFKFTPEGGCITVSILEPTPALGMLEFTVADNGSGMPASQIHRIFDRFYQVDDTQTREHEGFGIGLALTKELVEAHRGTISVESEEGRGTTFTVRIPIAKERYTPEEIDDSPRVGGTLSAKIAEAPPDREQNELKTVSNDDDRPLVLVIEDNSDMRHHIQSHLQPEFRTSGAVNGREGIEEAISVIPDLIISDVMMPKMDGFEVCRRLKADEHTSHIPIILLTAKADSRHKVEGLEIGADDYLVKPFDVRELCVRVRNLVENRRMMRKRFGKEILDLQPGQIVVSGADEIFMRNVKALVEAHMADETFGVEQLAEGVSMSYTQLHRKLHALTDFSAGRLIRRFRLLRAMELLQKGAGTVSEIAYSVGFGSPAYFTKCFREEFGALPSEITKSPMKTD